MAGGALHWKFSRRSPHTILLFLPSGKSLLPEAQNIVHAFTRSAHISNMPASRAAGPRPGAAIRIR